MFKVRLKLLKEKSILPPVPAARWDHLALSTVEMAGDPTSDSHRSQILHQEFLLGEEPQPGPTFSDLLQTLRQGIFFFQSHSLLMGLTSAQAASLF